MCSCLSTTHPLQSSRRGFTRWRWSKEYFILRRWELSFRAFWSLASLVLKDSLLEAELNVYDIAWAVLIDYIHSSEVLHDRLGERGRVWTFAQQSLDCFTALSASPFDCGYFGLLVSWWRFIRLRSVQIHVKRNYFWGYPMSTEDWFQMSDNIERCCCGQFRYLDESQKIIHYEQVLSFFILK